MKISLLTELCLLTNRGQLRSTSFSLIRTSRSSFTNDAADLQRDGGGALGYSLSTTYTVVQMSSLMSQSLIKNIYEQLLTYLLTYLKY